MYKLLGKAAVEGLATGEEPISEEGKEGGSPLKEEPVSA